MRYYLPQADSSFYRFVVGTNMSTCNSHQIISLILRIGIIRSYSWSSAWSFQQDSKTFGFTVCVLKCFRYTHFGSLGFSTSSLGLSWSGSLKCLSTFERSVFNTVHRRLQVPSQGLCQQCSICLRCEYSISKIHSFLVAPAFFEGQVFAGRLCNTYRELQRYKRADGHSSSHWRLSSCNWPWPDLSR